MRMHFLFGLSALFAGCIGTDLVDEPLAPNGSRAVIDEGSVTLTTGEEYTLSFSLIAPDGSELQATWDWSSRDEGVVVVDQNGTLSATGSGQTWVDGLANNQFRDSVLVSVGNDPDAIASVTITADSSNMMIGETRQLAAVLRNFNGMIVQGDITWTSSDPNVAGIDPNGLVTAIANGTANITATAGGKSSVPFPVTVGQTVSIRTGTFTGLNGYSASGTAVLEQTGNNAILFFSEDFQTQNGPGLYVYLSRNMQGVAGGIELGKLTSTSSSQSYSIPPTVNASEFSFVFIYCKPFGVPFGRAELK